MSDWSPSRLYPARVLDRREYERRREADVTLADLVVKAYADPIWSRLTTSWTHDDLDGVPLEELRAEYIKATMRSAYASQSVTPWLRDRIRKLDELIARHRAPR